MNDRPIHSEETGRQESDQKADGFPSEPEPITPRERTERWFEVASSILLAIVAVATAWSGYQSALHARS
jgi:type VI protein secretion system component VasF